MALFLVLSLGLAAGACEDNSMPRTLSSKAKALWEQGNYHDAARNFISLTELYPNHPLAEDSLFWAASIYAEYLDDRALAARYYQQLLGQFPQGEYAVEARESLAAVYEEDKSTRIRAIQLYRQLLSEPSTAERHHDYQFRLGRLNLKRGELDQARFEFRTLLKEYPDSPHIPETHYLVGYSYYLEERYPLALAIFDQLSRRFPDTIYAQQARFFMADTLEEQGQVRDALRVFESLEGRYHNEEILATRIQSLKSRLRRSVR